MVYLHYQINRAAQLVKLCNNIMTTISLSVNQERVQSLGTTTTQFFVMQDRFDKMLYVLKDNDTTYFDLFATVNVNHPSAMWGSQIEIDSDIINIIKKDLENRDDVVVNQSGVLFAK